MANQFHIEIWNDEQWEPLRGHPAAGPYGDRGRAEAAAQDVVDARSRRARVVETVITQRVVANIRYMGSTDAEIVANVVADVKSGHV